MDRQDFADDFVVDTLHLNRLQDDIEADRRRLLADLVGVGIAFGLTLVQLPTPALGLRITPGVAYTPAGRRVEVAVAVDVDLTQDHLAESTAPSAGQERYLAVYLRPTRTESEPWTDGNGDTHPIRAVESYAVRVVKGASASPGLAVVPAPVHADDVLLGRVLRAAATTAFYSVDVRLVNVARVHRAADVHAESVERQFEVVPTDPPSLSVVVSAGSYRRNGVHIAHPTTTVGPFALPSSGQSRVDLIYSNAGALVVRAGTPFATGSGIVYPETRGVFPVAFVALDAGQPAILPEHILDARPFIDVTTTHARVHRAVATPGQTVFTLPWEYEPGQGAIQVFLDGLRLDSLEVTETDVDRVALVTPATGGEVFYAYSLDLPSPTGRMPLERIDDDLSGLLDWRGCFTADRTGMKLVIPPIRCCILDRVRRFTATETVIDATGLSPGTCALYAKASGATGLSFEIVATQPESSGTWKAGTTNHRYLAPLVVDAGGVIYGFCKHPSGLYLWRIGDPAVLTDLCQMPLAVAGWGALNFNANVSSVARLIRGELYAEPAGAGEIVGIRARGTTGDGVTLVSDGTERLRLTVDVELNDLGQVDTRATAANPRFTLHGFWE